MAVKFDYIIGNPPYQENIENRGEQPPLYHYFYESVASLGTVTELITPARFLFNAGKTPAVWNEKMLNSEHFQVLYYNASSKEIFGPNVDIMGGIAVGYLDNKHVFPPIEVFIPNEMVRSIAVKIGRYHIIPLSSIMYGNTSYKYDASFFKDNPEYLHIVSGGSRRYLSSSVFEKFPDAFHDDVDNKDDYARIIGRLNANRIWKYFKKTWLNPPANFNAYKVIVPASNGSNLLGVLPATAVIGKPIVGEPFTGHTETFLSFGCFDNKYEAENLEKYLKCRFTRFCIGIKKSTQGNKTVQVWSRVPLQDFTSSSDIDWSVSIPNIDRQLYQKYGLTQEEIDFIETHVKPME